jgi:hypothetical protein
MNSVSQFIQPNSTAATFQRNLASLKYLEYRERFLASGEWLLPIAYAVQEMLALQA